MAIKRKISYDKEKLDVISKGADVKDLEEKRESRAVNLKIPEKLLQEIDREVKKRLSLPRTAWILEAIVEKIKRDLAKN